MGGANRRAVAHDETFRHDPPSFGLKAIGWTRVDPIVAISIWLWVLPRTWVLLRDTINVLLEGVPGGLRLPEIRKAIEAVPGVSGVHDLHVWSTSTDDVNCTVHVEIGDPVESDTVRATVQAMLGDRFAIEHCTIQTEAEPCGEADHLHP